MKRILALVLVTIMLLCCAANAEDWKTPYDEVVDVHIAMGERANTIFPEGQDYFNNMWWDFFRENYNVNVIVDWTSDQFGTKLNLAIASGEIPDMFTCDLTQLNQLIDAGLLEDLTEAFETTASDSIRKYMTDNWDIVETGCRDGAMYAMPILHYGYECNTNFIWGRNDWLEAADVSEINSLDEVEELAKYFMSDFGAEYGLMLDKSLDAFYMSAPLFGVAPGIWEEDEDGTLVYSTINPAMKEVLAKWAEWYKEGLLRSDFAVIDSTVTYEDAYNSKVGLTFFYQWGGWIFGQDMIKNQGENSYFIPFDFPADINGNDVKYPITFSNGGYNVCRKGYEHPEVLIKLIDSYYWLFEESILEGSMTLEDCMPFNTNEMQHVSGPFKVEFASYNGAKRVNKALVTGVEDFASGNEIICYNECRAWLDNGDTTGIGRYLQQGPHGSVTYGCKHVDNNQLAKDAIWGPKPQIAYDYGSALDTILAEGFTLIIMGEEPVDYFDTIVENWKTAGGNEVTDAVNAMYGNK